MQRSAFLPEQTLFQVKSFGACRSSRSIAGWTFCSRSRLALAFLLLVILSKLVTLLILLLFFMLFYSLYALFFFPLWFLCGVLALVRFATPSETRGVAVFELHFGERSDPRFSWAAPWHWSVAPPGTRIQTTATTTSTRYKNNNKNNSNTCKSNKSVT